jgi:hypothetical protein
VPACMVVRPYGHSCEYKSAQIMNDNDRIMEVASGGGSIIAGIVVGGLALVVLLFIFVDDIFTPPETATVNVELDSPQANAPVK